MWGAPVYFGVADPAVSRHSPQRYRADETRKSRRRIAVPLPPQSGLAVRAIRQDRHTDRVERLPSS